MRICKAHHFVQNGKRKHYVVFIIFKKSWNSDLLGNRCSFAARGMIKSHLWPFVIAGTESKGEDTVVNFLQCHLLSDAMLPFGISSQPVHWSISSSAVNDFHCVKIMKFLPHIVPSERVIFTLLRIASPCVHYLEVCCITTWQPQPTMGILFELGHSDSLGYISQAFILSLCPSSTANFPSIIVILWV